MCQNTSARAQNGAVSTHWVPELWLRTHLINRAGARCYHACVPVSIFLFDYCFIWLFTILILCFYMKHVRDSMDEDDRQRLAQIVTETCVAVTLQDYIMFIGDRNQIPGRTVWKTPRIVHVFCIAVSISKRTYFFFCALCSFSWRHFCKVSVAGNYGYASSELWVKVLWNYRKTHSTREQMPTLAPEYKVSTLYSGTGTVPEFWRGYLKKGCVHISARTRASHPGTKCEHSHNLEMTAPYLVCSLNNERWRFVYDYTIFHVIDK